MNTFISFFAGMLFAVIVLDLDLRLDGKAAWLNGQIVLENVSDR